MKIVKLKPLLRVVAVYLALFLWLSLTDPRKLPIVLLIVPFVLLFTALFLSVSLVVGRFFPRITQTKRRLASACVAGLPTFLLILSSVNQLTWRDVALVAFLSLFLMFYASRAHFKN